MLVATAVLAFGLARVAVDGGEQSPTSQPAPPPASASPASSAIEPELERDPHALSAPRGDAPRVDCDTARRLVRAVNEQLPTLPPKPAPADFAELTVGWLDPHGLWSAAPGSALGEALRARAAELIAELADPRGPPRRCPVADALGEVFGKWNEGLVVEYERGLARGRSAPAEHAAFELWAEPMFEDDPVTRPATELADALGERIGAFVERYPERSALADLARERYFPNPGAHALGEAVLSAALRSYVLLVDPHGGFAPFGEEWALYDGDPGTPPGSPLWGDVARSAIGARISDSPTKPLQRGDVLLKIGDFSLVGANIGQIEQAARATTPGSAVQVELIRQGTDALVRVAVEDEAPSSAAKLETEQIRYGSGFVLRVIIPDVSDSLGERLVQALSEEGENARGVLLDLRGNGGGSTLGASDALGALLPGAPLFPLLYRGKVVELMRASERAVAFTGPLAVLVDGNTASAAEMIAGALSAYGRAVLVGRPTFGKGCIQEYFDELSDAGVLRLTTLQFALPDGSPLQRLGLTPQIGLPLPAPSEREADSFGEPDSFVGPDVRDGRFRGSPSWPAPHGALGPCQEDSVCLGLGKLGARGRAAEVASKASRTRSVTR